MSVLEWILITEGVVLALMGVMGLVSLLIARQDPDDPISVFCATFWREFLWPPQVMPTDSSGPGARASMPPRSASARPKSKTDGDDDDNDGPTDEDARYGRFKKDEHGRVAKADLIVLVNPHAPADNVLGRDGDGMRVQVVGEAGESRSNKALVEMVANSLGVKSFQVTLTKGHYQPRKTVQIQGISPDELQNKLANLADAD